MTFTFGIPAANNNPSNDQPLMQGNYTAISNLINVDHIGFNTATSGLHQQIHLPNFTAPTVINGTLTQGSLVYPAAGVADTTRAQIYFKNDLNVAEPISAIKAFGTFTGGGVLNNGINLTAVHNSTGAYTFTVTVGVLTGSNYCVFAGVGINALNPGRGSEYVITNATTFQIVFRNQVTDALADPDFFSVLVLQI